jgi:two-component system response regulator RegX3
MKILIVEDEELLRDAIAIVLDLHCEGVEVIQAPSGEVGLDLFSTERPDLVLLDLNLPGIGGLDVLRAIRRIADAPVIIMTARNAETEQVQALSAGADDYLVKPFSPMVLLARIEAVLRRSRIDSPVSATPDIEIGDLEISLTQQIVRSGGTLIHLTSNEFKLLACLARNSPRVVPLSVLAEQVWSADWDDSPHAIASLVSRLRAKLGSHPAHSPRIDNARRLGYRMSPPSLNGG